MRNTYLGFAFLCLLILCSCNQNDPSKSNSKLQKSIELDAEKELEYLQRANMFFDENELEKAIETVEDAIEIIGQSDKLIHTKYKILLAANKYEEALKTFEIILNREGSSPDIVIDKIRLLMKMERFDEALKVALDVDRNSNPGSQFISLMIIKIYLEKKDLNNSLKWMEITYNRGFNDFDYLLSDEFNLVHNEDLFLKIIKEMKIRVGIDLPVEKFSISQFNGEIYNIANDQGKVILLDFWATWCPPCVAEYPNLIKLYEVFHSKGFEIVSISADSKRESVSRYLEKNEIPWINGFSGKGRNDHVIELFNIESYPTYFIIDRDGKVNYITGEGGSKLNKIISDLLSN